MRNSPTSSLGGIALHDTPQPAQHKYTYMYRKITSQGMLGSHRTFPSREQLICAKWLSHQVSVAESACIKVPWVPCMT